MPGRRSDLSADPLLVDAEMIAALHARVTCHVESVASPDDLSRGTSGMAFSVLDHPAALSLPGPAVHRQIAEQLGAELLRLL